MDLPASADAVYGVVTDYARLSPVLRPGGAREADVLESSDRSARIHFVWPYPFPFRRRDAIVAYLGGPFEAGGHRLTWSDDARASDPSEGVRIRRVAGETRIAPLAEGRCRVTYTFLGDLGGDFPDAFETKAWRHEPLGYVYALRRRLGLPIPPK